ncbi:MAG TPA: DUF6624 domain-containing protein [Croceibacterium sp.]
MVLRSFALALGAFVLCAADYPDPPPALAPYIDSGRLAPADYAWIEGSFAEASPEKRAEFEASQRWIDSCVAEAKEKTRDALAAAGYPAASLDDLPVGPLACRQAKHYPRHPELTSYAQLREQMALARPVADSFLMAVGLAAELGNLGGGGDFARSLAAQVQLDQMLGRAFSWGAGAASAGAPELPPVARAIVVARLETAYAAQTERETAWLKAAVAQRGWPTESTDGQLVHFQAWLLAQHADHDPLFQLEVLRLMEPLAERGEVSKSNHAYLHDRIMLKLTGRQRYGTQAECVAGERRPKPLEEESALAGWRTAAGLESEAEYLASLDRTFGPCSQEG